jgi:hypothetical protein
MALAATTIWESETGGNDTNNGGAFDPGQTAGMFTDGAATSATGTAPVFTSASYNFVAGDVGAWVYVSSGTNWLLGWYKISSVASNAATLDATIGHAVQKISPTRAPNTVAGCATTASPTAATWTIDYSQQSSPVFSYTDLASAGAGLTVSSAAHPFNKQQVGNCLVVTSGTNFNTGRYVIASVAANVATVVGPTNITSGVGSGGNGGLGGALASPGVGQAAAVASNTMYIASGTYVLTSGTANASAGVLNIGSVWYEGYGSVRGDLGTAPVLQITGAGTVTNVTIITKAAGGGFPIRNLTLDGNNQTGIQGLTSNQSGSEFYKLVAKNCKNGGFAQTGGQAFYYFSRATNCVGSNGGTNAAFAMSAPAIVMFCEADSNTSTAAGFYANSAYVLFQDCLAYGNTGDGFQFGTSGACVNCVAYNNSLWGFNFNNTNIGFFINCIAEQQTVAAKGGYRGSAANNNVFLIKCAAYNNTTNVDTSTLTGPTVDVTIGTSTFFTSAGTGDFSLNSNSGGGALARGTGIFGVTPSGTSTGALDMGAIQHSTAGGGGGMIMSRVFAGF